MLRNCACLVIAHMVDATQLCGGVGWGGVGMMTFFELEQRWMLRNCACLVIAHMVDATQLCGGVGWGGDDDIL